MESGLVALECPIGVASGSPAGAGTAKIDAERILLPGALAPPPSGGLDGDAPREAQRRRDAQPGQGEAEHRRQ